MQQHHGRLERGLAGLQPFIYVAHYGLVDFSALPSGLAAPEGMFTFCRSLVGQSARFDLRGGYILPIELCRNEQSKALLRQIPALTRHPGYGNLYDHRQAVQELLNKAFHGQVFMEIEEPMEGYLAMDSTGREYQQLHEEFSYVTAVARDTHGKVMCVQSAPFPWSCQDEHQRWYSALVEAGRGGWETIKLFFVYGPVEGLCSHYWQNHAQCGVSKSGEAPARWFTLRPELKIASVSFRLQMAGQGWIFLEVGIAEERFTVYLSQHYDPLPSLLMWGEALAAGNVPLQVEIDEEGVVKHLTVLTTDVPDRVLFRVAQCESAVIRLEGIVSLRALVHAFREEIKRFFQDDFVCEQWNYGETDPANRTLQSWILSHRWLAGGE